MAFLSRFLQLAAKRNDLFLITLLIAIVFMMILPLPTPLVDMLIGLNLALAAVLLMVAMYLKEVTQLSAFPSILLLTTLFRLALSITTTRLILLQGDAGEIVTTFGEFVVGGNLIVGLVVFLILTIVSFLVITKGSERVAEVSARFSLDAMPGKQMSIDSDMRAGLIELDEAKRRRSKLEKESQLYGAMDGAMKFVKGDAIASLIIIAVNLIGGIAIGTLQRGLPAGEALQLYALLSIGDGLVAQIPALFISMTAGFIVTRVASEDNDNLGADIAAQLIAEPKALAVTTIILLIFAAVPGFPPLVFLLLAALTGGGAYLLTRQRGQVAAGDGASRMPSLQSALAAAGPAPTFPDEREDGPPPEPVSFALTVPLIVDIAPSVRGIIRPEKLDREIARVRRALYFDLGVPFPGVHLRVNENLAEGEYRILVNEIPVASGQAKPGHFLVRETESNLNLFNIPFEKGQDFLPRTPSLWVHSRHQALAEQAGVQVMTFSSMLTFHLGHVLKAHASEFIGIQECMYLMNQMQKTFAELVKEATRMLPVITITDVLQRLVAEEISIRDMRTVLEALVEWGQREKDAILLTEHVRAALSRFITHKFSGGQNVIPVYTVASEVEDAVRGAIRITSGASHLALSRDTHMQLIKALRQSIAPVPAVGMPPVLLVHLDIRRFMRKIVEREFPDLAVLSYEELTPAVKFQPLDRIRLA